MEIEGKILAVNKKNRDAVIEFVDKFWAARILTQKNLLNESEQAYVDAADFATKNDLLAEARIADAAVFELKGKYEEAAKCLNQVNSSSASHLKGIIFFMLGSVTREQYQEQPLKAIEHYLKAISEKTFDRKGWAHNNVGNLYFRNAGLNPIGARIEDFEKASYHYEQSLSYSDTSKYITYYNQGRLALAQNKYDDAILKFDLAVGEANDDFDMHGCCYREMGTAYMYIALDTDGHSFHDAISCWDNARRMFDEAEKRAHDDIGKLGKSAVVLAKMRIAKLYRDRLKEIKGDDQIMLLWWPPEETGADGYSTPEERIFSMIEATGRDRFQIYNTRSSSRFAARKKDQVEMPAKDVLAILRGWGSATPLIEDAFSACVGGGYYLKWQDKGLVIDPGLDFMRNFRACGFHMREVDAVIVSHDHTDHNADLRAIDDVFYEMYRRADEDDTNDSERNWHYYLVCDERTKNKDFLADKVRHRSVIEIKEEMFKNEADEVKVNLRDKGLPFIIHGFKAKHGLPAYCLRIECLSSDGKVAQRIGFTCDTEYFDDLKLHLSDCDILIAHISQPTLAELLRRDGRKPNHLGYRGVSKLIKECTPKLTILGEFWAGFADMRIDLTKGLKRICNHSIILPSSVGLFIAPKDKVSEIECTNCKKWRPVSSIYVGAANYEYGPLAYLCPLCRI